MDMGFQLGILLHILLGMPANLLFLLFFFFFSVRFVLADNPHSPLGPDGLIPQSDNLHPPYMSVYKGVISERKPNCFDRIGAYAAWLNRTQIWGEDTLPSTRWDSVEGDNWQLVPWGRWVQENPARRFVICVPLIPGKWDGSGTDSGDGAHQPITLELGAAGKFNDHYKKLAENLVKNHLGNSILRLGWEFNGGWYSWKVSSKSKAVAFAKYWQQIVSTMRSVPGTERLQFAFNPNNGCYDATQAYPGDEYVDYIGLDAYDDAYAPGTYPWAKDATQDQILQAQKNAWDDVVYNVEARGLGFWDDFAKQHHKEFCIPEWGVNHKPDHHGGGDDPYYVEQMYKFIYNPANNVGWYSYFDVEAPDGHHQLSPKSDGTVVTEFPKAAAKFRELFSLPKATTAAPSSAPVSQTDPAIRPPASVAPVSVLATEQGISINLGDAGTYTLSYPRLLDPVDGGATPGPDHVTLKPDGTGATITYRPSGRLTVDHQPDGSWLYHLTDIPSDRIKFAFGIHFPLELADTGATWSFDSAPAEPFPKTKGELNLYQGNPATFVFRNKQSGFVLIYPQKTWTVFNDQRVWGKDFIGYGQIFYFPGKKHVSEISYSFKVGDLSSLPALASVSSNH